jgi:membrane-associated phospholipid phosphatase
MEKRMSILKINDLALQLVANDFSKASPAKPSNAGPTRTSRALAIIHLAAHDAYAKVAGGLTPRLAMLPTLPVGIPTTPDAGTDALLGAGLRAAVRLYPDDSDFISIEAAKIFDAVKATRMINPRALRYGEQVADAWLSARKDDGSDLPQDDKLFDQAPGRHRPDPLNPNQTALGRTWGIVTPFVLKDVAMDAPLPPPPDLKSPKYATSFDDVLVNGKNDITLRDPKKAITGIFWGYDGSNKLGTPPRLYNQVVRAVLKTKTLSDVEQIRILTAINVAMADAGIAAWYWKYEYDFWRPVVGIREAEAGWGPTGKGDGNAARKKGDPFWLPLGAPNSNPRVPTFGAAGSNGTPGFPAYPSGHSTFGSAAFMTLAKLLNKQPKDISFDFVSDEFNGVTTDNTGATRPKIKKLATPKDPKDAFTLQKAIEENAISRIYLGVHWDFDATGGETVGNAIAEKVFNAFKPPSP